MVVLEQGPEVEKPAMQMSKGKEFQVSKCARNV